MFRTTSQTTVHYRACRQRGLPLHVFPWRTSMRQAGLARNAGYLLRPDGHVALADLDASAMTLQAYRGLG